MANTDDTQTAGAVQHEQDRARAELRLLACVAPLHRWGMALASLAGITIDHFGQDDTRAIFAALIVAEGDGRIIDREKTYGLAILSLKVANLWDDDDSRTCVAGMRWGPGALAAIFARLNSVQAENLLPSAAQELIALATPAKIRGAA